MGRSVIGLGAFAGSTIGSFVPTFFGASAFGLASLAAGVVGGVLGVFAGARLGAL